MTKARSNRKCLICKKEFQDIELMPAEMVRPAIAELLLKAHPEWSPGCFVCFSDLNRFRTAYVEEMLSKERGEMSELESDVVRSLEEHNILAANINKEFESEQTFGGRLADKIAEFGGSWTFLICFAVVLFVWMAMNSIALLMKPFDPFPFIFLNLILYRPWKFCHEHSR